MAVAAVDAVAGDDEEGAEDADSGDRVGAAVEEIRDIGRPADSRPDVHERPKRRCRRTNVSS